MVMLHVRNSLHPLTWRGHVIYCTRAPLCEEGVNPYVYPKVNKYHIDMFKYKNNVKAGVEALTHRRLFFLALPLFGWDGMGWRRKNLLINLASFMLIFLL